MSDLRSEDRDQLFWLSSDILAVAGLDGLVKSVNPAAERALGYHHSELVGKPFLQFIHPTDLPAAIDTVRQLSSEPIGQRLECRMYCKDGSLKWISWGATPDLGHERIYAVGRDITERKQMEEDLHESEERYRLLVERSPDAIVVHVDGRIVFANQEAANLVGIADPAALIGRPGTEFVRPTYSEEVGQRIRRNLDDDPGRMVFEEQFVRADGTVLELELATMRLVYHGQLAIQLIARDISERKRSELALRESVKRLRRVLEGTIDAMALTVETRDPYTAGHQRGVARLAVAIARELGLEGEQLDAVRFAATVHDIGKICIPAEILSRPGPILPAEMRLVQTHPRTGHDILKNVDFPWPIADIVLQHHERLDGSGYPRGLHADEILFEARILAVADVVEAMASHRPYRPALGVAVAIEEIHRHRGVLFEATIVDTCASLFEERGFVLE